MTKYQMSKVVMNPFTGQPYTRQITEEVTIRDVIIEALLTTNPQTTATEKTARGGLAYELAGNPSSLVPLSEHDTNLIKAACAQVSSAAAYYAVILALEEPVESLQ